MSDAYKNPGFFCKTTFIQLGYAIWVNLTAVGIGMAFAFPSVMVPQLMRPDSDIHPSMVQESWIASVLTLSAPVGCLISGYLSDRFGRATVLFLSEAPMGVGWIYTGVARTSVDIVIGRLICGVGCGMAMSAPRIYMTEISLPNIRGVTAAISTIGFGLGITTQAGLGVIFSWRMLCYLCGAYSIILLITNFFIPETPHYILLHGSEEKARHALTKFRCKKHDIESEMRDLIKFKTTYGIRKFTTKELWPVLWTPFACRPFALVETYFLVTGFCGTNVIIVWGAVMLQLSKCSVEATFGNFILGITRFLSSIATSIVLFKIRRRSLGLVTTGGLGIISIVIGLYIHFATEPTIFPQLCFMVFTVFSTMGYCTLPFLFMSELFPLQLRGLLVGVTISSYFVFLFIANFLFIYEKKFLGFANTIIMFGLVSIAGYILLYIYALETKEFTLAEIEEYYRQKHPIRPYRMKHGMDIYGQMRHPEPTPEPTTNA